jgi:hypothetical protein
MLPGTPFLPGEVKVERLMLGFRLVRRTAMPPR